MGRTMSVTDLYFKAWALADYTVFCLVVEISMLLLFFHSNLSNKVIFPLPGLVYNLVIFSKTTYYFVKRKLILLVICRDEPIPEKSRFADPI
jgi:hypothetical protein